MRERCEEMNWYCEDSIIIVKEGIVREKHQYSDSTESTEMRCLVNFATRMDIDPWDYENV